MLTTNDVRSAFLSYFGDNGHQIVPSAPLVPHNDPTLLFVNAGMVPFKALFTGKETRPYVRAVSSQKCVRAGGKHNDLDQVGYTARHHTFFEMLGNFSFGDYFKEAAITLAWRLVTQELGIDAQRLWVTVYHTDEESALLWSKITGLPDERIIRITTQDNFWSMGDTGPCGPCTEIFYDHGDHIYGGLPGTPHQDGDRFVEIWNIVFMQYEKMMDGSMIPLPKPSVDTGAGLERLTAVLQGVSDNYATDLFQTLIHTIAHITHTEPDGPFKNSLRVVADHLRASCFLMADGVMPANEGRGYVLRRIMRRAMRHAHMMAPKDTVLHQLVPSLVQIMGGAYPELNRAQALTQQVLELEEQRFKETLDRGLSLLEAATVDLTPGQPLPGTIAFKLYDTFGFPLDLTQDILRKSDITVDQEGFDAAMAHQRAQARLAWKGSGASAQSTVWYSVREAHGATDFIGYEGLHAEGLVTALVQDGVEVQALEAGQHGWMVTNQTPFYGESGGQAGDHGILSTATGTTASITDTHKFLTDVVAHAVNITQGRLTIGDTVSLSVDPQRRADLRANHSATHILHGALREVLGDHITQKGSLVEADKLRFDFAHAKPLTQEEITHIETLVNDRIRGNYPVITTIMSPEAAMNAGAMALFGEKYGDEVRVVRMGRETDLSAAVSLELCGGTHVVRTGDIGLLKVLSDASVASGVRRIEALTGRAAVDYIQSLTADIKKIAATLRTSVDQVLPRVIALQASLKATEKLLTAAHQQHLSQNEATPTVTPIGDSALVTLHLKGAPTQGLKNKMDDLKTQHPRSVIVVINEAEGKLACLVGVTPTLTPTLDAPTLLRAIMPSLGGQGGGGLPDLAQGGGTRPEGIAEAFAALEHLVHQSCNELTGLLG